MGLHHSKAGKARRESNGRSARSVTAALRAVDTRNVHKLQKALKVGAAIGNVRRPPGTGPSSSSSTNSTITTGSNSDSTTQSHSTSLLEYAVEKNFIAGVDIMLKVTSLSDLHRDADSVSAAFMRSCDNGYLRLGIFNLFVDAAIDGRIQLDLKAVYHQLVDHYMYRKPYELARRPSFQISALVDADCRITPLGLAVIHEDVDAIESFVRRGADVNGYDREGNTALLLAAFSLKRNCFHKLLLLGADTNKRSRKRGRQSLLLAITPLLSVCVAYGQCTPPRMQLIAELVACGADPSVDRMWFEAASDATAGSGGSGGASSRNLVTRRLDEATRRALAELCVAPRRLQTLCAGVVRNRLAAAEFDGVVKNADRLPLPLPLRALIKLELTDV